MFLVKRQSFILPNIALVSLGCGVGYARPAPGRVSDVQDYPGANEGGACDSVVV